MLHVSVSAFKIKYPYIRTYTRTARAADGWRGMHGWIVSLNQAELNLLNTAMFLSLQVPFSRHVLQLQVYSLSTRTSCTSYRNLVCLVRMDRRVLCGLQKRSPSPAIEAQIEFSFPMHNDVGIG